MKRFFLLFLFPFCLYSAYYDCCTEYGGFDTSVPVEELGTEHHQWDTHRNELNEWNNLYFETVPLGCTGIGTYKDLSSPIVYSLAPGASYARYGDADITEYKQTCNNPPVEEPECNNGYTLTKGYTTLLPSRCNSCVYNRTCEDAYTLRQMTDSDEQLCCIKFDNSDDEVEAPEIPDNNATPLDLNPTNEILEDIRDDANLNADQLEQEERETQERLDEVNRILEGIQRDNSEHATADTSNNNANTDREIKNDNANANQAHQDQVDNRGKYDDIILGLREVKDATTNMTANANANSQREIDNANANAEQAHTDAQNSDAQNQENADRNHEDLEGIKDSIDNLGNGENFTGELTQAIDGLSNLDGMIEDGRESIMEAFNGMVVDYTGLTPVFTATGDCVESFEVFGTTIELDFNFFATAKFAFDIIFTLLLAFMTFKIYFFIFISLTQKA